MRQDHTFSIYSKETPPDATTEGRRGGSFVTTNLVRIPAETRGLGGALGRARGRS